MVKIKPLKPCLRENNRYLLFEAEKPIDEKEINMSIKNFIGELGVARANPVIVIKKGKKGVIKLEKKHVNNIKMALMLNKENNIRILKVSGILNKIKEGI